MSEQAWDLSLEVRCDPTAPSRVRHELSERVNCGPATGDLMLIASELVTNAVRHSGADPNEVLGVGVRFTPDKVVLAVCDPGSSDRQPATRRGEVAFGGGFGLRLVELLCARWGSEKRAGRHRVWAEILRHPTPAGIA